MPRTTEPTRSAADFLRDLAAVATELERLRASA